VPLCSESRRKGSSVLQMCCFSKYEEASSLEAGYHLNYGAGVNNFF
jgi:hypothetical protein